MVDKFIVIEQEDVKKYLSEEQISTLQGISSSIALGRINEDKDWENKYLVVNQDEPYADAVRQLIKSNSNERVYPGCNEVKTGEQIHAMAVRIQATHKSDVSTRAQQIKDVMAKLEAVTRQWDKINCKSYTCDNCPLNTNTVYDKGDTICDTFSALMVIFDMQESHTGSNNRK